METKKIVLLVIENELKTKSLLETLLSQQGNNTNQFVIRPCDEMDSDISELALIEKQVQRSARRKEHQHSSSRPSTRTSCHDYRNIRYWRNR